MNRTIVFIVLAAVWTLPVGCTQNQDPWVTSEEQFADERERSAEESQQLRNRLAFSQIDR